MKDPLDKEQRPYEVLGVSPDADIQGVQRAYSDLLRDRKRIALRPTAGIAYDRMRRVERRLEDELFYYPSGSVSADGRLPWETTPFDHEPVPPSLEVDLRSLVLHWPVDDTDFRTLSERKVQISNVSDFEERLLSCLPIEFPK